MKTLIPLVLIVALLLWKPGTEEAPPAPVKPDKPEPAQPVTPSGVWDALADWDIETTTELAQIVRKLVENEVLTPADVDKFDAAFPDFLTTTRALTDEDREKLRDL